MVERRSKARVSDKSCVLLNISQDHDLLSFFFFLINRFVLFFFFLYGRFLLVINFIHISVYMSIPIAQFITPPPRHHHRRFPPLVSIHLFSTSVSQFLPCKPFHLYHFSRLHIYALIYDICFSLSDLTSLGMTVSRSIYVSTNEPISFLFMAE